MSNRWGRPVDLAESAELLATFPKNFGDWEMVAEHQLAEPVRKVLNCAGYVSRGYVHGPTKALVNLVVIVGPPGPTSVHTPDVCYSSQAYRSQGGREAVAIGGGTNGSKGQFWMLTLRPNDLESRPLRTYYAWSDGGTWNASENPRLEYGGKQLLYKLQLATSLPIAAEANPVDPGKQFLQDLLAANVWPLEAPQPSKT